MAFSFANPSRLVPGKGGLYYRQNIGSSRLSDSASEGEISIVVLALVGLLTMVHPANMSLEHPNEIGGQGCPPSLKNGLAAWLNSAISDQEVVRPSRRGPQRDSRSVVA